MNIWEVDKALLFLALVLPGFISIKMYSLMVAGEYRNYSNSLVEAICYSVVNFSLLSWLILLIHREEFVAEYPLAYWASMATIFLFAPAIWPFVFIKLSKLRIFKKTLLSPYKQPWDYVFNKKEAMWVVIHLKSGEIIRGKYAEESFASCYPSERQLYIEEVWVEEGGKKFSRKANRTKGIIISQDEISYIKFYGK